MRNRQLKGKGFLLLACLIMVICLVQRVALLHQVHPPAMLATSSTLPGADDETLSPGLSPCQLSAHSLLIAQPLFFDYILPVLAILLAAVGLLIQGLCVFPPVRAVSPPVLRIHLKNCVFRE